MKNHIAEQFRSLVSDILEQEEIEQMDSFFDNLQERFNAEKFVFTDLQKNVIENRSFWKSDKNNIVLGSTSAGKTLAAELNMAYQIYCKEKKVLYLVPLKVLTTEKQDNFRRDFAGKTVLISSSDYQEHDYELVRGEYDIGILVYEKFFALLADNNDKFLDNCSLVVIDELHMLSVPERGPKLEFSIEKIRFNKKKPAAILGLTTSECDVSNVKKWLGDEKTVVISSENRPIIIEERFIYCDPTMEKPMLRCFISGEEQECPEFAFDQGANNSSQSFFQLCQVLLNHPDDHIVIFCNSKRSSIKLVNDLCNSGVLKKNPTKYETLPEIVDTDMEQHRYDIFRNHLEQYCIAYHNASLSLEMRDFIETQFRENNLRIVVATETLTMGVNMPTDIMILYDYNVFRGDANPIKMKYQEYKNAIGRAGRLGLSKDNKGISYLLVGKEQGQMNKLIDRYVLDPRKEKITSGIMESDDKYTTLSMVLAPFYLNLLNSDSFMNYNVSDLLKNGLGKYENSDSLANEIIDVLMGENPINKKVDLPKMATYPLSYDEMEEDGATPYIISKFGKKMSPFALSIRTYQRIRKLFISPPSEIKDRQAKKYPLPRFSSEDPYYLDPEKAFEGKKSFFLDVIFIISGMYEIKENRTYLYLPTNSSDSERLDLTKNAILHFFQNIVTPDNMLWEGSVLLELCNHKRDELSDDELRQLYRTVVLFYWIQGFDVRDIRKKLNLPDREEYYIYTVELESLGELYAYQLEAISKGFESISGNCELSDMFYALSIRIKYGMSSDLSRIANKHIRGINRAKLLRIEKEAHKEKLRYISVTEFIMKNDESVIKQGISDNQLRELRNILQGVLNYQIGRLEEEVQRTALVDAIFLSHYKKLEALNAESLSSLGYIFSQKFHQLFQYISEVEPYSGLIESSKITIYLCTSHKKFISSEEIIHECSAEKKLYGRELFIYKNGDLEDRASAHNCMEIHDFCILMLKCILYCNSSDLTASGKHFIDLLNQQIGGKDITSSDNALKDELMKMPVTTQIINNNTYITNSNVIINNTINLFNGYEDILLATAKSWEDITRSAYSKLVESPNEADEIFSDLSEKISLPDSIPAETVYDAAKKIIDSRSPDTFDSIEKNINNDHELLELFCQAVYAEEAITQLKLLTDYSPAATMYNKTAEHCLKKRILPILRRDCPDRKIKKWTFVDVPENQIELGTIIYAIKDTYCNNSEHITNKTEYWRNIMNLIREISNNVRNPSCHSGDFVSLEKINLIADKVSILFKLTNDQLKTMM